MLAPTAQTQNRRNPSAEPPKADNLTADTCAVLQRLGLPIGPSKVSRLVHRYQSRVAHTGYPFAAWIANGVALHAEQRRQVATEIENRLTYADPTANTAIRNVLRDGRRASAGGGAT